MVRWTGAEFIVAGGNVETAPSQTSPSKEAAAFNPKTGQWRRLPDAPQPLPDDAVFAWTGIEFIVVGGSLPDTPAPVDTRLRGVAYSPATNQWRRVAPSPLRARWASFSAWTGNELLVWGGVAVEPTLPEPVSVGDGAAYNPTTDTWRSLPAAPRARGAGGVSAWTGDRWVIGGGENGTDGGLDYGWSAYHPADDTWARLPDPSTPAGALVRARALIGKRLFTWTYGTPSSGVALDLGTNTWKAVASVPGPLESGEVNPTFLSAGNSIIFVGAELHEAQWRVGTYDTSTDTWADLPTPPVPPRQAPGVSQGGGYLLLWGGFDGGGAPGRARADGALTQTAP